MKHILILLFSTLLFSHQTEASSTLEPPYLYQTDRFDLSTIDLLLQYWNKRYPEFQQSWTPLEEVTYRGQSFPGYVLNTDGVKKETRFVQELTYIQLFPGLLKLVFVESKTCVMGEAINEQRQWEYDWRCTTYNEPLSGYDDPFILESDPVDLEPIKQAWGRNIVPYKAKKTKGSNEKLLSLGDLRAFILLNGGQWQQTQTHWQNPGVSREEKKQEALLIQVSSPIDLKFRAKQSFLYAKDGNLLLLKEINGTICHFAPSMGKDLCDPIHVPTPGTPFPFKMSASLALTRPVDQILPQKQSNPFSCGNLSVNMAQILKFHFERQITSIIDLTEHRRYFSQFPRIADPLRLLISQKTFDQFAKASVEPYPHDDFLKRMNREIRLRADGRCAGFISYIQSLKEEFANHRPTIEGLLKKLRDHNFDHAQMTRPDLFSQKEKSILMHPLLQALPGLSSKASLDIASQRLKTYFEKSLERLSNPEWFVTAAMASQDRYSGLIENRYDIDTTLNGQTEGLYFGFSVDKGLSGNFYILSLHPQLERTSGIKVGDRISKINGIPSKHVSIEQFDKLLIDKKRGISVEIQNQNEEIKALTLQAQAMDPIDQFLSVRTTNTDSKKGLWISLSSFQGNTAQRIQKELMTQFANPETKPHAIVLDLRGNSGGSAQEALNLASVFVRSQPLAALRIGARNLASLKLKTANPEYFVDDQTPLLILVDERTASAAEILASTLKDLGRSLTIGTRTYGKFVNQFASPILLTQGKKLQLLITSMEFYSPSGIARNGRGLWPDLLLHPPRTPPVVDGNKPAQDIATTEDFFVPPRAPLFLTQEVIEELQQRVEQNTLDYEESVGLFLQTLN